MTNRNTKASRKKLKSKFRNKVNKPNKSPFIDIKWGDGQVFMNPNKDKSVKETKILNKLASICEKDVYKADRKNINAGFELNPADFKWEYHVDYFNSRLVLKEFEDGMVYMWMYLGNKDKFDADYEGNLGNNMNALVQQVTGFCMASAMNYNGQEVEFKQIEVE